uniref:Uncharacterized protein n=1 Tax=Dulem virus 42 TaxID=3145760 RepID=A0AAU8BA06_9CAUD
MLLQPLVILQKNLFVIVLINSHIQLDHRI